MFHLHGPREKRKIDLDQFLGKNVEIVLYRKHRIKKIYGKLMHIGPSELCLANNGISRWINKPVYFRDSIREIRQIDEKYKRKRRG